MLEKIKNYKIQIVFSVCLIVIAVSLLLLFNKVRPVSPIANQQQNTWGGRVLPYFKNGVLVGLKMLSLDPNGGCEIRGIHNGDVVIELNGKPVEINKDGNYSVRNICDSSITPKVKLTNGREF